MPSFPDDFLWGASTAAHQTEGGNIGSDWWVLEHAEGTPVVEPSGDACDSFHRYAEDISLLAAAGLTTYRFSVEWARIEPAPGEFSRAALDHYQAMVDACLERGVEPIVTLHHFTNPYWMRQAGGWEVAESVGRFERYVERVVGRLQGVRRFCTINEPNMIATWSGALQRAATHQPRPDARLSEILLRAHERAVDVAHGRGAQAGLTLAMTAYTTDGTSAADEALATFRSEDEDVFVLGARGGDFLGVQAYSRRFVSAGEGVLPQGHDLAGPAAQQTLTGWTYYPQAIGDCLRRAHELAPDLPLIVTENGLATSDDEQRIAYTSDALRSVLDAVAGGVPVLGYLHWSLLDNFEWIHGYGPTFGLVSVDRETFVRTPKPSLGWLGRVAKDNALPA